MNQRRVSAAVLALVVVLATPAVGVAAADERVGGTVVVEAGETVDGNLQAVGGTVVVRGTVTGNLEAFAGTVDIADSGEVTGSVEGAAGSVTIDGAVGGDVRIAAGSLDIGEAATITGDVQTGVGSFSLAGAVEGNVEVGAGSITLRDTASVAGDFVYDGDLTRASGATIGGELREDPSLGGGEFEAFGFVAGWLFTAYSIVATLVFGAILLALLPGVAGVASDETRDRPLRTVGAGFLAFLAGPVLLVAFMLTIVGIPLAFLWLFAWVVLLISGFVLGEYAVGAWLLSVADYENKWLALAVGVLAVFALGRIPVLGGFVEFAVLLVGLGAFAVSFWRWLRDRRRDDPAEGSADAEAAT
jgi:cytoskeletal protein CcmA (bactofilin family)